MTSIKTYTGVFVALMIISTIQFVFEASGLLEEMYVPILAVIFLLSSIKAAGVMGWFMHLREEPRALTYIVLAGVIGVLALTAGAAYSIT